MSVDTQELMEEAIRLERELAEARKKLADMDEREVEFCKINAELHKEIARRGEYAGHLAELLQRAKSAMRYWMPDETMVTPPEEGEWDRCIKLIDAIDAAIAKGHEGNTAPVCEKCGQSTDLSGTYCTVAECPK